MTTMEFKTERYYRNKESGIWAYVKHIDFEYGEAFVVYINKEEERKCSIKKFLKEWEELSPTEVVKY